RVTEAHGLHRRLLMRSRGLEGGLHGHLDITVRLRIWTATAGAVVGRRGVLRFRLQRVMVKGVGMTSSTLRSARVPRRPSTPGVGRARDCQSLPASSREREASPSGSLDGHWYDGGAAVSTTVPKTVRVPSPVSDTSISRTCWCQSISD